MDKKCLAGAAMDQNGLAGATSGDKNRQDAEKDETIIITHYVNPYLFAYLNISQIKEHASELSQLEKRLPDFCNDKHQLCLYEKNAFVIVHYQTRQENKHLRGVVFQRMEEEHLVLAFDYGFTINSEAKFMWPLPTEARYPILKFEYGAVDKVIPWSDNDWSSTAIRYFGVQLDKASQLQFKITVRQCNLNFGQLSLIGHKKIDAAMYLQRALFAHIGDIHKHCDIKKNLLNAQSIELTEINHAESKSGLRVTNVFNLIRMESGGHNLPKPLKQPIVYSSPQNVTANAYAYKNNCFDKNGHYIPPRRRVLSDPNTQPRKMDVLVQQFRVDSQRPATAKLVSKVKNKQENSVFEIIEEENTADKKFNSMKLCIGRPKTASIATSATQCDVVAKTSTPLGQNMHEFAKTGSINHEMKEHIFKEMYNTHLTMLNSKTQTLLDNGPKKSPVKNAFDNIMHYLHAGFSYVKEFQNNELPAKQKTETYTANFDKLYNFVVAHSSIDFTPIDSLQQVLLDPKIEKIMKIWNSWRATPLQHFAWPHLNKGNSVFIFKNDDRKRTSCYLPVLCSLLLKSINVPIQTKQATLGPMAILVTDSVNSTTILAYDCKYMLEAYIKQRCTVVNAHAQNIDTTCLMLLHGCVVLVTTLNRLAQLLERHTKGLTLFVNQRLQNIIVDDYDKIMELEPILLRKVLNTLSSNRTMPLQLIVVAQHWRAKQFKFLLDISVNPMMLFENFLEAAMYGGIKLKVQLLQPNKKMQNLLSYLELRKKMKERIVIFGNTNEELQLLFKELTEAGHQCLSFSQSIEAISLQQYQGIMLLTDELHSRVPVRDMQLLVHYTLPDNWMLFNMRFRTVADRVKNFFTSSLSEQRISSFIMLDEHNLSLMTHLVRYLMAHDIVLDQHILDMSYKCDSLTDHKRSVCDTMLSSGDCTQTMCPNRHRFLQSDLPQFQDLEQMKLRQKGTLLRCKLAKVYDPVNMAVLPTSYKTKDSKNWTYISNLEHANKLTFSMPLHMSVAENRKPHVSPRAEDVCIIDSNGVFKRVRVLKTPATTNALKLIDVCLMDDSTERLCVKACNLLECDENYRNVPPQCLEVRLAGFVPEMGIWPDGANKYVSELLGYLTEKQDLQMTVDFALQHITFVEKIAIMEVCEQMNTCVYKIFYADKLLSKSYCKLKDASAEKLRKKYAQLRTELDTFATKHNDSMQQEENELACVKHDLQDINLNDETKITTENLTRDMIADNAKSMDTSDNETQNISEESQKNPQCKTKRMLEEVQDVKMAKTIPFTKDKANETNVNATENLTKDTIVEYDNSINYDLIQNEFTDFVRALSEQAEQLQTVQQEEKTVQVSKALQTAQQEEKTIQVSKALKCAVVAENAVRPKVKWNQTHCDINLFFENAEEQFELIVNGNCLVYEVTGTVPVKRCILNLLGDVKLCSKKQNGFYVHVKLEKIIKEHWPILLNSLYAQQNAHWLVYDVEHDKEESARYNDFWMLCWTQYDKQDQIKREDDNSSDVDDALSTSSNENELMYE